MAAGNEENVFQKVQTEKRFVLGGELLSKMGNTILVSLSFQK